MRQLEPLMMPGPSHALRALASMAVLAAFLLLSCGVEDGAVVSTTSTSLSSTTSTSTSLSSTTSSETNSSTSSTDQTITGAVTLRGDGLGAVSFGQDEDEVILVLERLLGSPPTVTGSQADWVGFVGWADLGLFVGFDTPTALDYSGTSRFVGWEYFGSDGGTNLTTTEGASVGTVFPELQALYGDRLEVSTAIDECVSGTAYPLVLDGSIYGLLDQAPGDDARVSVLRAGIGVGC